MALYSAALRNKDYPLNKYEDTQAVEHSILVTA